jgi:hypothetical protein
MFRKAMRIRTRLGENTYQPDGPKTCEHTDVCENVDLVALENPRSPERGMSREAVWARRDPAAA